MLHQLHFYHDLCSCVLHKSVLHEYGAQGHGCPQVDSPKQVAVAYKTQACLVMPLVVSLISALEFWLVTNGFLLWAAATKVDPYKLFGYLGMFGVVQTYRLHGCTGDQKGGHCLLNAFSRRKFYNECHLSFIWRICLCTLIERHLLPRLRNLETTQEKVCFNCKCLIHATNQFPKQRACTGPTLLLANLKVQWKEGANTTLRTLCV